MEIIIKDSAKVNLTDNEYKYLRLLEFYDDFVTGVQAIRNKFNIRLLNNKPDYGQAFEYGAMCRDVYGLLQRLKIPLYLQVPIQDLVMFYSIKVGVKPLSVYGACQFPSSFTMSKEEINNFKEGKLPNRAYKVGFQEHRSKLSRPELLEGAIPVIAINKRVKTKTELCKLIKQEWEKINEAMNDYEMITGFDSVIDISTTEIEEDIKLLRLRRKGFSNTVISKDKEVDDYEGRISKRLKRIEDELLKLGFSGQN